MTEPGLLLIRGLGHSGSTLLDLVLGGHPSIIGVGEASRVLLNASEDLSITYRLNDWREQYTQPCTCGLMIDECPLWSRFFLGSPVNKSLSFFDQFSRLISPLSSPSTKWIVESYQSDRMLFDYPCTCRNV